jgi:hypothetical protein
MIESVVKQLRAAALLVASVGVLAGCSGGGSPATPTEANVNADILKVAVGTANIFGDDPGAAVTGLNVAAAFRQPAGALSPGGSAVLVSTPTLSGPMSLPAAAGAAGSDPTSTVLTGPAPGELGGSSITGTAQGGSAVTSFGTSGGVFGLGIEPFNYGDGAPFTNVPYPVPLYDRVSSDPNEFVAWGGPPAFDLAGNGQSVVGSPSVPAGQAGLSEGLDVFAGVTPRTGTYSLAANVPANTAQPTITATATLGSTALLGAISAPVPTLDGNGGASLSAVFPSGVVEAYLQVTDIGPTSGNACNSASPTTPIYYTIEVTAATQKGTLPDAAGPSGAPSLCSPAANTTLNGTATPGDQFLVQAVGFDYPMYENSYTTGSSAINPSPSFAGGNGQADVTISSAALYAVESAAGAALIERHVTAQRVKRRVSRRRF